MKKVSITLPQQGWGTTKTKYPADSGFVALDDLTGASKNFDSTVKGNLTKRPGGVNYEQTADPDGPNKDQFEAIFTDGVHHLLKVVAGKLKFSSGGGTFTTVTTGYSPLGNFEFALYGDRVYFDNGIDSPQVYDRATTYGGVIYTAPQTKIMGAQPPLTPVTFAADTAGGAVPAGGHTYKVTFLYYDFEESNGGPASALHTVANPNNTVHLTAVPIGGYGVTARKIYRDDNNGVWLLVGTISDNTTTIFTDAASTGTALIPLTNNVPPSYKYITTNLDRTWIAGIPGDPSSLRFSEAGLPDIFPSANDILCNPEDPITALVVYDKKVWVFNRNSIGRILGNTRDTFQYVPLPGSIGCVDNRSIRVRTIQGVPTLIWLSDKGVYGTNGSSVEYLSDAIEDLVNLNIQQATQVKGQNAQTSQGQFSAGTSSPGIDLATLPGTITTPNPRRVWDDEGDWEGGSSLTNIATNLTGNQIRVPILHSPAYSSGTHAGTSPSGSNVVLSTRTNFAGEDNTGSAACVIDRTDATNGIGQKFSRPYNGTITSLTVVFQKFGGGVSGAATIKLYQDAADSPGSLIYSGPAHGYGGTTSVYTFTDSVSIGISGGTSYWLALEWAPRVGGGTNSLSTFGDAARCSASNPFGWRIPKRLNVANNWVAFDQFGPVSPGSVIPQSMDCAYSFTQTPVGAAGLWTGPIYDSLSDSAVAATISATGSYPAGTSSVTSVEASNSPSMSGASTQNFANIAGSPAVTLSNFRYWRIKVQLTTTDDRFTPTVGQTSLAYSTTGVWISEAIDHTTDITTLNALTMVSSAPGGTSITLEIATSANNIAYTAFGPIGSAVVQRYSKVRLTLTTNAGNTVTPTVTSTELNWTVVANLVSSVIDTGSTPAGWDIFQAQFALNGSTVQFFMRSATTAPGLTAETFVTVTNGQFPAIPVRRFVQWKVIITSTANAVPTVDSVTVNWFISQVSSIRVASIFYNRSYYLAAAEFNQTTNNLLIVLDGEGKWRIYRGINVNTLSLFFNDPYFGSATEGRIIRFLSPLSTTDQGTPIQMIVETKALDYGDLEHDKVGRKVYISGRNTGAVYQVFMSFDAGDTFYPMLDVLTGLTSFTTATDDKPFYRRFQLNFTLGNVTSGKTITIRIVENTAAAAEISDIKSEAWIRQGELV